MSTYDKITQLIVDKLGQGVVPWRRPWASSHLAPTNLSTLKPYRGINVLLTSMGGWDSPYWLTFNQARDLGANVRKGEKGTPIVFYTKIEKENADGDKERFPLLRTYTVFNVAQVENLRLSNDLLYPKRQSVGGISAAQRIVDDLKMVVAPTIFHRGDSAFYRPSDDLITVPQRDAFQSAEHYYATLYHELAHASGHERRLARKELMNPAKFGSHEYSREELVAEMCSAFLCAEAGIDAPVLDNAAAYIASWLKVLSNDTRMVILAAAQAQKAADLILGRVPEAEAPTQCDASAPH